MGARFIVMTQYMLGAVIKEMKEGDDWKRLHLCLGPPSRAKSVLNLLQHQSLFKQPFSPHILPPTPPCLGPPSFYSSLNSL